MRNHYFCCSQNYSLHPLWVCPSSLHLAIHLRSTSPATLCTLHHTTTFYFLLMFQTSPEGFITSVA